MSRSHFRRLVRIPGWASLLATTLLLTGCDFTVNTVAQRNVAIKEYNEAQYAEAAGTCRTNIRQSPGDYGSHYFLGASLAKMGQYEQAIQQYKTCLAIMSHDLVGKDDRKFRLQCLNSLADAVVASKDQDLNSAVAADSTPAEGKFLLAKINRGLGDADAALEDYSQASLMAPKDFDIAKENGLYLLKLSQTDKARSELRRAYALNPKDEQVAQALRQVRVVPGPSLKNEKDMASPIIPVGPIPRVELVIPASGQQSKEPVGSPEQ